MPRTWQQSGKITCGRENFYKVLKVSFPRMREAWRGPIIRSQP